MNIKVSNDVYNDVYMREIKLGFSWTYLFFGCAVSIIREDWKWAIIHFVVEFVLGLISPVGIALFLYRFFMALFYNKIYAKELVKEGYSGITEAEERELQHYIY